MAMKTLPGLLDADRIVKLEQRVAELERGDLESDDWAGEINRRLQRIELRLSANPDSQGFATSGADGSPPPVATRGEPLMAEERCSAAIYTNGTTVDGRPYRLPTAQQLDEVTATVDPDEYMCVNCVTPWKCNGPHHELNCATNGIYQNCDCSADEDPLHTDLFHIGQRVVVYTGGYPVCKPGTVTNRVGEKWRVELDKASGVTVGEGDMVAIPAGWR